MLITITHIESDDIFIAVTSWAAASDRSGEFLT